MAQNNKYILVTGGAGYIGSHTCIELLSKGEKVVVVDNLCNSDLESLNRVREITMVKICANLLKSNYFSHFIIIYASVRERVIDIQKRRHM